MMAARNLDLSEDHRLNLRIGVNLGDVFCEGKDVFGDGVNIAARLESIAPPGGIYISRAACDPIRERLAFDFEDLGERRVKILRASYTYLMSGSRVWLEAYSLRSELTRNPRPPNKTIRLARIRLLGTVVSRHELFKAIERALGTQRKVPSDRGWLMDWSSNLRFY
jgi:hypothetical protein